MDAGGDRNQHQQGQQRRHTDVDHPVVFVRRQDLRFIHGERDEERISGGHSIGDQPVAAVEGAAAPEVSGRSTRQRIRQRLGYLALIVVRPRDAAGCADNAVESAQRDAILRPEIDGLEELLHEPRIDRSNDDAPEAAVGPAQLARQLQ
jgi:hypothetical protein